jgi:hypothetical protein
MSGRCLKILVLLTLVPVALRASSLFLSGRHGGVPATSSSWRLSRRHAAASTGSSVSAAASSLHKAFQHTTRRRRRKKTESATADTRRRLRRVEVDGGDWFEDDKRLAPTGSNPLHNLRR